MDSGEIAAGTAMTASIRAISSKPKAKDSHCTYCAGSARSSSENACSSHPPAPGAFRPSHRAPASARSDFAFAKG